MPAYAGLATAAATWAAEMMHPELATLCRLQGIDPETIEHALAVAFMHGALWHKQESK